VDFSNFFDYTGDQKKNSQEQTVLLADLPEEEWNHILSEMQSYRFSAGDVVVKQGDASRIFYLVASGDLEVVFIADNGREKQIMTIAPLTVFGEQAFLDGRARSATVRALTSSEVRGMTIENFDALAARYPDLARKLLFDLARIVSLRLRETTALAIKGKF
jgi:CRP/FNR family cyclic AMP-dependent transcriptional regulator